MISYIKANLQVVFRSVSKQEAKNALNANIALPALTSKNILTYNDLIYSYINLNNVIYGFFHRKYILRNINDYYVPVDLTKFNTDVTYKITNGIYLIDDEFECYTELSLHKPYNNILNYFTTGFININEQNSNNSDNLLIGIFHTPIKTDNITFIGGIINYHYGESEFI